MFNSIAAIVARTHPQCTNANRSAELVPLRAAHRPKAGIKSLSPNLVTVTGAQRPRLVKVESRAQQPVRAH